MCIVRHVKKCNHLCAMQTRSGALRVVVADVSDQLTVYEIGE